MDKSTEKHEDGNTEEVITPKLVFSDDALVVDYLNALLTSSPAITLESGEIHFVHMAIGDGWKPGVAGTEVVTPTSFHDNEQSNMEANVLRNENENLRFKAELAKIDVQVLRSENNNLKAEVSGLKSRLHEMEHSFETMMTENSDLRLRMDAARSELDSLSAQQMNARQEEQALSLQNEPSDAAAGAAVQEEEPVAAPTAAADITADEVISENPTAPVVIEPTSHTADKIHFGNEQDTALISAGPVTDDLAKQKPDHDVVFSPRKSVVAGNPTQVIRPASKIIKQQQQRQRETEKLHKDAPQKPLQRESYTLPAEKKPDLVQLQQEAGAEVKPGEITASNPEIPRLDDTDDIRMEPAPAPQVVVRRNVRNYEELQKETDSANKSPEGHTIIL